MFLFKIVFNDSCFWHRKGWDICSFVEKQSSFCFVLLCFHARLFVDALWSPTSKWWPLGSRLWCLIVTLLLSHWYPGSGVVLDCIDSWSLPFFILYLQNIATSDSKALLFWAAFVVMFFLFCFVLFVCFLFAWCFFFFFFFFFQVRWDSY